MKYLSIVLLSLAVFSVGPPSPSAETVPTSTTIAVGQSWNPASLTAPPVAPPSLTNIDAPTTLPTIVPPPLVSPDIMAKWATVAQCETGSNWHSMGSVYQGGIGILVSNWYAYGGFKLFGPLYDATPEQQVFIARKIQALAVVPNYVPDQYGCGRGW